MVPLPAGTRYVFGDFALSPARRQLLKRGTPVPLIPKYFDLLTLLLERRTEALGRQVIFDAIWPDVVVSESALTQAIRTLRRALDDSPRAPVYIRTISRHGYQFVFSPVAVEEEGAEPLTSAAASGPDRVNPPVDELVARMLGNGDFAGLPEEERRAAAIELHASGTQRALAMLEGRPGAERARALLRESRWDVEGAGEVPILNAPGRLRTIAALVALRMKDAARAAAGRWSAAAAGGVLAGTAGGLLGGTALVVTPDSRATGATVVALAIIGGMAGLLGAGMIGGGLAAAEIAARSQRRAALIACGTLSGALAALLARIALDAVLGSLLGSGPQMLGGPIEGAAIGCAAALGYAVSTHTPRGGGMATPRGADRFRVAAVTAIACGVAAALLGALGRGTVSVSLDALSLAYDGSQVGLAPLAPLLGEQDLRPLTRAAASGFEGLLFGFGLAFGLTRRPSP